MKITDKQVFFYGGFLSQWYPSNFIIDGVNYVTAEQYMMAKKALVFNDLENHKLIMGTNDPKKQKEYGRKVKNFNKAVWDGICRQIVYEANLAKFTQNTHLKQLLLSTGDKELVEASPFDTIWGIGLAANDKLCLDRTKWRGTNWLGIEIMKVRNKIKENG